ncbi:MAG: hypothetical protein ABWX92_09550, partial [Mycetocola sp.]
SSLYPDRDSYLLPFNAAVDQNVADGFIAVADGVELKARAESSIVGLGLSCEQYCANVSQFPLFPSTQSLRDQVASIYQAGGDQLVALLDGATLSIARGQTVTSERPARYAEAVASLRTFQQRVDTFRADGRASAGQTQVMVDASAVLIEGLTKDGPDKIKPVATLVAPTVAGPFPVLSVKVDATDDLGLNRVVANIYKDGKLVKSTQTTANGAKAATHAATVTLPDGAYSVKYNASDLAGNVAQTGTFDVTIDATKPVATVKDGASYTVKTGSTYDLISFKLSDAGKIDRVELNGKVKDLTNNQWSDVNYVKPGVFGGVKGANTLVVFDVAGNTQTYTFTLN